MKIAYVLPLPELSGGNKVAFQHAELLRGLGHEVAVFGAGPAPAWFPFGGPYFDLTLGRPDLPRQDLLVATYWTTVGQAEELGLGPVAHFCQGYEGNFPHLEKHFDAIGAAYGRSLPTLVVTPYLASFLAERFGTECRLTPPPSDPAFRPRWSFGPRRRPWIALAGIFEAEVKGIATGLEAVRLLRKRGLDSQLLRYSPEALSAAEKEILQADRYLHRVPPKTIAQVLPSCDLLLMPSRPEEGFGLPMLEAMVSQVPVLASRIPSTEFISDERLPLLPVGDACAFADAAEILLTKRRRWQQARRLGREQARKFSPRVIAKQVESAVLWAAGR